MNAVVETFNDAVYWGVGLVIWALFLGNVALYALRDDDDFPPS